ncbi:phosphotransferase [Haloplasma contractile]|nr:phosphotransferase [Haloplasma contractile]
MKQPDKWRETMDPFTLTLKEYELREILGYPHAGNDVFYVNGIYKDGKAKKAFLKVERQKTADIKREVSIINQLCFSFMPKLLDYSIDNKPRYLLTEESKGERLSYILGNNENLESCKYMDLYGELLAKIHNVKIDCEPVKPRDFTLDNKFYEKHDLGYISKYLNTIKRNDSYCFIHGDCHYANILWDNNQVSCLLDFELSGYGSREYDLAWALALRPGQKFLKTLIEYKIFLKSYRKYHTYCQKTLNYYLILFQVFFYKIALEYESDVELKERINLINDIINTTSMK